MEVAFPRPGTVLTCHDGTVRDGRLHLDLQGVAGEPLTLHVAGLPTVLEPGPFRVPIVLTGPSGSVPLQWNGPSGPGDMDLPLFWERSERLRYRFSVDDNVLFLRDIARQRPRSLFDHPYLGFWRRMHERYGARIQFNIYYQCEGFDLREMPDQYRSQWEECADWIRLTFHALQDEPARPYRSFGYDEVARDFDLVTGEIRRWAGERLLSPFTTVHWGETTRDGARALRDRGILGLVGYFTFQDGQPFCSYYLDPETTRALEHREAWVDVDLDMIFVRHDMVVNSLPLEKAVPHLESVTADPHQSLILELMIHEQYFRPELQFHQPDAADKVERVLRWVTEHGYESIFYEEDLLR